MGCAAVKCTVMTHVKKKIKQRKEKGKRGKKGKKSRNVLRLDGCPVPAAKKPHGQVTVAPKTAQVAHTMPERSKHEKRSKHFRVLKNWSSRIRHVQTVTQHSSNHRLEFPQLNLNLAKVKLSPSTPIQDTKELKRMMRELC